MPENKARTDKVPIKRTVDFELTAIVAAIQSVRAEGLRQTDYSIHEMPDLLLTIYASGRASFGVRCRIGAGRPRLPLGNLQQSTLEQIETKYLEIRECVAQGGDPRRTVKRLTYAEFFDLHYLPTCRARDKRSLKGDISRDAHWLRPKFGTLLLSGIDNLSLNQLIIEMRAAGLAASTINNTLSVLNSVVNLAVDLGCLPANPLRFKRLRVSHRKSDFMNPDSMAALYRQAKRCEGGEYVGSRALMLMSATGARLGECLDAKHDDFDLTKSVWTLSRQKSGKPGVIFLSEISKQIVEEMRAIRTNEYLFPGRHGRGQLSRPIKLFKRLCEQAGISPKTGLHGLRHAWASYALNMGAPVEVVSHALRHSSPQVTRIYSHPYETSLKAANETVASLLASG